MSRFPARSFSNEEMFHLFNWAASTVEYRERAEDVCQLSLPKSTIEIGGDDYYIGRRSNSSFRYGKLTEVELYYAGSDPPTDVFIIGAYDLHDVEEWEYELYSAGFGGIAELCSQVEEEYFLEFLDAGKVEERKMKLRKAIPILRGKLIELWRSKGLEFE